MTTSEAMLQVLQDCGDGPIDESDVVVRAHQEFPALFGMNGYGHFPDSKRVSAELSRLVSLGVVTRPAPRVVRLTGRLPASVNEMRSIAAKALQQIARLPHWNCDLELCGRCVAQQALDTIRRLAAG